MCNTGRMNILRAILLVLIALLIPGGTILLVPMGARGYRWLVEARARRRAAAKLAPATCVNCQSGA